MSPSLRLLPSLTAIALISCGESAPPPPAETGSPISDAAPQSTITITQTTPGDLAPEIEAILLDPILSPEEKGTTLLQLAPRLRAPSARAEALENALLLLAPEDYGLALSLATTPSSTPEIQSSILEDALLREAHLRLPALLRIASSPHTSKNIAATALATLAIEIGQDYGTHWASWSDAIEALLEN